MTTQEAAKPVAICLAMWPNHPVTDPKALVKGWELGLAGIPYRDAEQALQVYLQEGKFFPSPAEIRTLAMVGEPELDAKLYRRYSELRRDFQTGNLGEKHLSEMARIERKLGIPTVTDRPVPLRAVSG